MKNKTSPEGNNGQIQKIRIIAGTVLAVSVTALATIIGVFSASQSAGTILGIVAMSYAIVLIVIFLLLMPKSKSKKPKFFHMHNPVMATIVAIISTLVTILLGKALVGF